MATAILPAADVSASDPMPTINRPAENVREISLALIDPPTWNPRRSFDQAELDRLAASLSDGTEGQLQPVIVRKRGKRFQIVAGERRYRAALQAKLETLTCTVRDLEDKAAAELQLKENVQRRDLDPIELAVGFKVLCDMGHTVESLAELVGAEASDVGSRLGLLALPDAWQQRIRRGEITPAQAEYLVPWRDRPEVLAAMAAQPAKDLTLSEWKHRLGSAAMALSRSMDPLAPDGPQFLLVDENMRRLDVVSLELRPGTTVKRAMNVGLWDELQDRAGQDDPPRKTTEAESGLSGSPRNQSDRKRGLGDVRSLPPDRANGNGKARSETESRALPANGPARRADGPRYGQPVLLGAEAQKREHERQLAAWKAAWLRKLCHEAIDLAEPSRLPAIAQALGVDAGAAWRLRRDFLELFAGDQLQGLGAELGVDLSDCRDDGERRAVLLSARARMMPAAVRLALSAG